MTTLASTVEQERSVSRPSRERTGAALTTGLAAAGVVLALIGANTNGPAGQVRVVLVLAWAAAAVAVVGRGRRTALGVVTGVAAATAGICAATATTTHLRPLHALAATALPALAFHLELALPDGLLGTRIRRNAVGAAYAVAGLCGVGLIAADVKPSAWAISAAVVSALVVGLPASNQRYQRAVGVARQRLQLIGCAVAVVAETTVVVCALRILVARPHDAAAIAAASTALIPIALAVGTSTKVARNVDRVLLHTVSVTGLTAVVVAVYLVVVVGLGRAPTEAQRTMLLLSMLAAAVAALLYVPARERLAEVANRMVYGERHPPDEVLRTWGTRLSRAVPMDELLLQLAESLRKVMDLTRAEVWTGASGRLDLAVSVPDRSAAPLVLTPSEQPVVARAGVSGNAWIDMWLPGLLDGRRRSPMRAAPACHSGEILGLLVVERSADGDAFSEEDERVLAELARQLGLALHNVQLDSALQESLDELKRTNDELRASRARIVATGDAERRKIERNLHDGAQQHLVALAVNLRLAKEILGEDPEGAAEMLDALADSVKETIQEVRNLAHGIFPPLLMDSGLPDALRAAAARTPVDVAVEADGVGRHPMEVEAAVYFCCLEALQNVAKHAPDASVTVKVVEDDAMLRFEVADNGPGFHAETAMAGHGYMNMSDRVGAIGGSVEWRSQPGLGTTIAGELPIGSPRASGFVARSQRYSG